MRELARDERGSLGVGDYEALDPYALCEEHGVHVYTVESLRSFGASSRAVLHFTSVSTATWSAALVPIGSARIIIENETHVPARRRSSIAHELGHFLLEHEFSGVLLGEDHKRQFDPAMEKQATYLSGELLVPEIAARRAAYKGWDNEKVAQVFNVSTQFAQMQMKGPRVMAARAAKKYAAARVGD
ncbi:ImmA/IrrE family metallo-endopeptidase [Pseudarthrobacter psychrotolerans]|uniref:ImmA/IrrE family metallo-endopeptidase n=1 Tax=Pseudarthrobacter psychrotolerans TaxID=2697569 RepID=A0A6P1NU83_9MICC|nr:ImmA/IrrE family metallo-endopeptidase [Pseudarthrobacter psychrotolerans]